MKEVKQMLDFYGLQMPNQINSYTWFLLMKELAKRWSESNEDFASLEIKLFMDKCKYKLSCCLGCPNFENCKDTCYTKTFDCQDCPKNI